MLDAVPLAIRSNVPCWSPKTMIAASISSEPDHRVDDELDGRAQPRPARPTRRSGRRAGSASPPRRRRRGGDPARRTRRRSRPVRSSISPKYARGRSRPVQNAYPTAARHHDDRQPGQPEREAVEADVVGDVQVAEPGLLCWNWIPPEKSKRDERVDPQADLDERDEKRERAGPAARQREEPEQRARRRPGTGSGCGEPASVAPPRRRGRGRRRRPRSRARTADEPGLDAARVGRAARATARSRSSRAISGASTNRGQRRGRGDRRPVEDDVVQLVEVELVLEHVRTAACRGTVDRAAPSRSPTRRRSRRRRATTPQMLETASWARSPRRAAGATGSRKVEIGVQNGANWIQPPNVGEHGQHATGAAIEIADAAFFSAWKCSRDERATARRRKTRKTIRNV